MEQQFDWDNNEKSSKPPLGAKPCWMATANRIKELCDAIIHYRFTGDFDRMYIWAEEVSQLCSMAAYIGDISDNVEESK